VYPYNQELIIVGTFGTITHGIYMVPFELIKLPYWVKEWNAIFDLLSQSKSPDSDSRNTQHQTHRLQDSQCLQPTC